MSEEHSGYGGSQKAIQGIAARTKKLLRRACARGNKLTGGVPSILKKTIESFGKTRGSEAAAGMAYYALFSLFPLMLFLVAVGGFILDRQVVLQQAVDLISQAIPASRSLISDTMQQVVMARGSMGLVGLVGTLWSAMGFFAILTRNVNRAWPDVKARNFFEQRLVALGMVAILVLLLALSLASTALLNGLSQLRIPLRGDISIYETALWPILSILVPWFFAFLLFLALYRWVPNTDVPWPAAFWAALVVASVWQIAANAFTWYVGSGLANYRLVYGSLGTIIILLFWIYLSSWLTILGAHLSAAVAHRQQVG